MTLLEPRRAQGRGVPPTTGVPARPAAGKAGRGAPAPRRIDVAGRLSTLCAVAAALLGVAVLAGWALAVPALTSVTAANVSMKANAALAFALGGAAVLLIVRHRGRAATAGGVAFAAVVAAHRVPTPPRYGAPPALR